MLPLELSHSVRRVDAVDTGHLYITFSGMHSQLLLELDGLFSICGMDERYRRLARREVGREDAPCDRIVVCNEYSWLDGDRSEVYR
jgi:hypothetical protein